MNLLKSSLLIAALSAGAITFVNAEDERENRSNREPAEAREARETEHTERKHPEREARSAHDGPGRKHAEGRERGAPGPEQLLRKLHAELEELKHAGRKDEAHQLERKIAEIRRDLANEHRARGPRGEAEHGERNRDRERSREGDRDGDVEQLERRVMHLRQAAENLKLAGKHREAQAIFKEAEALARQHPGNRDEHGNAHDHLEKAVEQLQQQVRELHEIVRTLQHQRGERGRKNEDDRGREEGTE